MRRSHRFRVLPIQNRLHRTHSHRFQGSVIKPTAIIHSHNIIQPQSRLTNDRFSKSKVTKKFVADTKGRLKLFHLPGYSPELNPDEWVWKNVKHDRIGKIGVTSKNDLKTKATSALRRLQKLPHLVRSFFHDPNLAYISA